ncbi:MAG: PIN domain-containing protein [Methanobacteriota archaeon]
MNIVIDSNILFSALIKDSLTRRLILDYEGTFLFPSYIFEEMEKHKRELLKKSKMTSKEFNSLLSYLLRKVLIVPTSSLIPYKKQAYEIVKDIDPDDVLFIACALAYPTSFLWSDDKKLRRQSIVHILNTKEMNYFLYRQR